MTVATRTRPQDVDTRVPSRVIGVIWALLVVNSLGSLGVDTLVQIPKRLLQVVTMGSLAVAFALALMINPRLRVRPNAFLTLLTLLFTVSVLASAFLESGVGALLRCARLAVFIATLWLLSRWWSHAMLFVRAHIRTLIAILGTVVVGLAISPGTALPADFDGRLVGTLWPITSTQVADYAAVVAGLAVVLWLSRSTTGRGAAAVAIPAVVLLLLTHTRTATVAMLVAVPIAALALTLSSERVRRTLAVVVIGGGALALAFSTALTTWFRRGQDEAAFSNLTGRQYVWDRLLAAERTPREEIIGVGLTDKSFGGLPIDSTWLAVYHEQGLVGVVLISLIMLVMLYSALTKPPSPGRACAVFLLVYLAIASYAQVGLGDVTGYVLHFAIAAALLSAGTADVRPKELSP